jgi:hypothetical protein
VTIVLASLINRCLYAGCAEDSGEAGKRVPLHTASAPDDRHASAHFFVVDATPLQLRNRHNWKIRHDCDLSGTR